MTRAVVRMAAVLALLASPALAACGHAQQGGGAGDGPLADSMVVAADPALRSRVLELLPDLEERSGLELRRPVRVEVRDREALLRYLEAKMAEELPESEATAVTEVYRLLGLLPDTVDLRSLMLSVYTEQVAGFYDPDSTALFLVSGGDSAAVEPTLVHELVHALQDQHADLDSLTASGLENDRRTASHAVIEGHATLVMFEHQISVATGQAVNVAELPSLGEQLRSALAESEGGFPALEGAPRIIRETLLFPYAAGSDFVQTLWRTVEGRPAPFGDRLPASTEQVRAPEKLLAEPRDAPTPVEVTVAGGLREVYANSLGELETAILLEEHLGRSPAPGELGWDGDRYVLVEDGEGRRSLVWYSVWDGAGARDRFAADLRSAADAFGGELRVTGLELGGRPGLKVEVGGEVEAAATLGGSS